MSSAIRRAEDVDLVFLNGPVMTVDAQDTLAEAVAVTGGRIQFVGAEAEARTLIERDTVVVDLAGGALLPGFTDNHVHLTETAMERFAVELTPDKVSSIEDIRQKVRKEVERKTAGEWIIGWGFDHHRLHERRYPTRRDLDDIAVEHPVALRHAEGMSWTANTVGLRRMGIEDDTADPPGGPMLRDEEGAPLGPMWDNCRVEFVFPALPKPTVDDLVEGYTWMIERLNAVGITSVNDANVTSSEQVAAYQQLRDAKALNARVYMNLYAVYGDGWDEGSVAYQLFTSGLATGFGDDWLRIGPVVVGVDGGVQGETAALHEPYSNREDGFTGSFRVAPEFLEEVCREAVRRRFQIAAVLHGDRALEVTLRALAEAQRAYPAPNLRHRLEHSYLWSPELFSRAAKMDVILSSQPPILERLGQACTTEPWGERARWGFPYRSALHAGIIASGGSDCPIATPDPLVGIRALMTHRMRIDPDDPPLSEEETIGLSDALRVYTANGAYGDFAEDRWGSIEVGKAADLVVLSADPRAVPPDRIAHDVRVEHTFVNGERVFSVDG